MITASKIRKKTIEKLYRTPNRNFTVANTNTVSQVPDLMKDVWDVLPFCSNMGIV